MATQRRSPAVVRRGRNFGRQSSTRPLAPGTRDAALRLLSSARSALAEAQAAPVATDRYAAAHLAALRAAAAILAARTTPVATPSRRPTSAWSLLAEVAPELSEWASCFAAGAGKRAAAQAGLRSAVSARDADDLVRDATTFLQLAETTIGVLSFIESVC